MISGFCRVEYGPVTKYLCREEILAELTHSMIAFGDKRLSSHFIYAAGRVA